MRFRNEHHWSIDLLFDILKQLSPFNLTIHKLQIIMNKHLIILNTNFSR